MSYQCKKCGSEVSEDALFCSKCGEKITALRCPNCGKRLPEDSAFCTYCGTKITVEQADSTQSEDAAESMPQDVDQPVQDQPLDASHPNASDQEQQPIQSDTASSPEETEKEEAEFDEQQSMTAESEATTTSDYDIDGIPEAQHHYHLTRRKLRINVRGVSSVFEETELDVSDYTVTLTDHLLNKDEPVVTRFQIPELRQIFVGRTISVPWFCSAVFFTIFLLIYLISDVRAMGARASGMLLILAVMSWIMAWYRTITFCFKDGKKVVIRGKEKDVMLELKQDILNRIVPEQDYVGDFSDIVAKNTQYYFPEFEKVEQNEKCRFNWAAFFFNGIFAYYRKSQEIFWYYYRWPIIIYAVIALGIAGTGCLAVKSEAGLMGWFAAAGLLSVAVNIYMLVTNIRFGRNFNRDYYQHCMSLAENSEITPRTVGTSVKNAVLYLIVVSFCAGLFSEIAGILVGNAILGGLTDNTWDSSSEYGVAESTKTDIVGHWEIMYYEDDEGVISRDTLTENGMSKEDIDDYFSGNYILFQEDGFCEFHSYDTESRDTSYAAWTLNNGILDVIDSDSNSVFSSVQVDNGILCLQDDELLAKYVKISDDPAASANEMTDYVESSSVESNSNRSTWGYDDYVAYYGFDPTDYGYEWYNEIRNGPLDEFFEMVYQELSSDGESSRLYLISDPYNADLTQDDFVGRWVTDGGIIFTIEYYNGEYSIDFTENDDLGILGGWFSESIYNVDGDFCGMRGSTGVTSFSISYEYSTDYPTHTWLNLAITESDGNEVWDYVPLT